MLVRSDESLSMLFVSLCCIVWLFNFFLFLSLGDEIKLLIECCVQSKLAELFLILSLQIDALFSPHIS